MHNRAQASGKIHQLDISSDQRTLFKIETFCFEKDGVMNITVRDFQVHGGKKDDAVKSGFIMVKTKSESAMQQMLEQVEPHAQGMWAFARTGSA